MLDDSWELIVKRLRRLFRLVAFSALALGTALAQTHPVFHAKSELVQVPVAVFDHQGQFVSHLTKDDFLLTVDGKNVSIANVDTLRQLNRDGEQLGASTQTLPPNTFTNFSPNGARPVNSVILLVDLLNIGSEKGQTDLQQLSRILTTFVEQYSGQPMAVYQMSQHLQLLQPFTEDRRLLLAAIEKFTSVQSDASQFWSNDGTGTGVASLGLAPEQGGGGIGGVPPGMGLADYAPLVAMLGMMQKMDDVQRYARGRITLNGLYQLLHAFGPAQGHKTVLWITGDPRVLAWDPGSQGEGRAIQAVSAKQFDSLMAQMDNAGISLFPVSMRALDSDRSAPDPAQAAIDRINALARREGPYAPNVLNLPGSGEDANENVMDEAARKTGGEALYNSNDVGPRMMALTRRWSEYYLLSFLPAKDATVSQAHAIHVTARKRGLHAVFRQTYIPPDVATPANRSSQQALALAMGSPVEADQLPIILQTGTISAQEPTPANWDHDAVGDRYQVLPFEARLPFANALHRDDQGSWHYDLTFDTDVAAVHMQHSIALPPTRITGTPDARAVEAFRRQGLRYRGRFILQADQLAIGRLVIRDNLSGKIGTMTLRINARSAVPTPTAATPSQPSR